MANLTLKYTGVKLKTSKILVAKKKPISILMFN